MSGFFGDWDGAPRRVRVLVGESVWEDATINVHEDFLWIEFDADDLDSIGVPLAASEASDDD